MRVVLRKSTDAQEAMQYARAFIPIHSAKLGQAHRQLAVTAQARFVNQDVAGAIHRLQLIVGLFDLDSAEHVLAVKIRVPAGLPQIQAHDVGRVNQIVAAAQQFVAQPSLPSACGQGRLWGARKSVPARLLPGSKTNLALARAAGDRAAWPLRACANSRPVPAACRSTPRKCAASAGCLPDLSSKRRQRSSA